MTGLTRCAKHVKVVSCSGTKADGPEKSLAENDKARKHKQVKPQQNQTPQGRAQNSGKKEKTRKMRKQ